MKLANVTLPAYTKTEEIINSVSHGLGIVFGIISCILLLHTANNSNARIGTIVFSVSVVILYSCSTLYHSMKKSDIKKLLRLLDHSTIFLLITGTSIALTVICVYPYNKPLAIVMSAISFILSTVGTILTIKDHEKYKKVQMVLYMVIGWISVVLIHPVYKNCAEGKNIIIFVIVGGIIYTIGTVFYAVGKKKKYFHCIFHFFVLSGTLLHFFGIYTAI